MGCYIESPNATQGELRLVDEQIDGNDVSGGLQVFNDGAWSWVCGTGLDGTLYGIGRKAASVACRQLGYSDKGAWVEMSLPEFSGPPV